MSQSSTRISTASQNGSRARVSVTRTDRDTVQIGPENGKEWSSDILEAFGSRSPEFCQSALNALAEALGGARLTQTEMNAGLALAASIAPANEVEAALAVQMAGAHAGAMTAMRRAAGADTLDQCETHARIAAKFMKAYRDHYAALNKARRSGAQTVRVEHVHVHDGGQAVVGAVTPGGGQQTDKQPHAQ